MVRVPAAEEVPIKKALDLGAAGIIAPQGITPEQAANVVRFARYAPQGARGVGLARAHGYGFRFEEYVGTANDQVAVIVHPYVERGYTLIVAGVDTLLFGNAAAALLQALRL